jgi:hypothetical protein
MEDAPKTMSVPDAGRVYFDLSRNGSYEAARRGEIPTIRIGGRLRVPVCRLERMLLGVNTDHPRDPGLIGAKPCK